MQSRPQNLNDAIRLAVELETFNRSERSDHNSVRKLDHVHN
jgi:hypothetical protein